MSIYCNTETSGAEQTFRFHLFASVEDNLVRLFEDYTWPELLETFSGFRDSAEKWGLCFIASNFKTVEEGAEPTTYHGVSVPKTVSRRKSNVTQVNCVILDYDTGVTIETAKAELEGLRHFGYTSFNHLKDGVSKFRIVIPLATPCPIDEWESRRSGLKEMFRGVDESTFSTGRVFFTPMSTKENAHLRQFWQEDGIPFDWSVVEPKVYQRDAAPIVRAISTEVQDAVLKKVAECSWSDYQDWLAWGPRLYHAGFDLGDYQHLSDSDRKTQNDCASWWKKIEGESQKGMGPLIVRVRQEFPHWSPPTTIDFVKGEKKPEEPREETTVQERKFFPITSSKDRRKIVADFTRGVLHGWAYHSVLRTPEGYGKSTTIVHELLADGQDVLFCCSSNKQADEKMLDFALYNPTRVWSRGGLLEKNFGIKPVMHDVGDFAEPSIDVPSTCELLMKKVNCTEEEAVEALKEYGAEAMESRKSRAQLLVTTFATGNMMFRSKFGSLGRVIVVDDPSMSDLITSIYDFNEEELVERASRETKEVVFGEEFAFQDKVIWTTTEALVTQCIQKHHPDARVKEVKEAIDTRENIHIIPTTLVQKATKKVLPGMNKAVEEDTHQDLLFLANGVQGEFNLVNTKGRNDLMKNTIIAISFPHPCDVASVAATLGIEDKSEVMRQQVTDVLDQAVGRSQGYREGAAKVLVLADPKLEATLRMRSRYRLLTDEGLKRRGRLKGVPFTWHVHYPDWWAAWYGYLACWHQYVAVFKGDVIETFTMQRLGKPADEAKLIERKLKKPAEFSHHLWKKISEMVEGEEGGRRNWSVNMSILVNEFSPPPEKVGKKKYLNPTTGKHHMVEPEKAPPGWTPVLGRQPKTDRKEVNRRKPKS